MRNVYLGARYSRHEEMQEYARDLGKIGYGVVSRWIWGGHEFRANEMGYESANDPVLQKVWGCEDWQDLAAADIAIFFTEPPGDVAGRGRGGRHVELGAALARKKDVHVVGYRENVFCWLDEVRFHEDWKQCLMRLHKP